MQRYLTGSGTWSTTLVWRKRQDRLAALFPLFAVAIFAVLTFWLDARVTDSVKGTEGFSVTRPDHFIQGFPDRTNCADDGCIESTMIGGLAVHVPATQSTVVYEPRYENEPAGKPRMDVRAHAQCLAARLPAADWNRWISPARWLRGRRPAPVATP